MDFNFILLFIDSAFLQFEFFDGLVSGEARMALGAEPKDAWVGAKMGLHGIWIAIVTMFGVTGFGILLNVFNSAVRRKMVDQTKLKRIMKETKGWQKERMAAMRSKDQAKSAELGKKSSYMNKMSGDDANEYAPNDDYLCTSNSNLLSCFARTILIHCSYFSNTP